MKPFESVGKKVDSISRVCEASSGIREGWHVRPGAGLDFEGGADVSCRRELLPLA